MRLFLLVFLLIASNSYADVIRTIESEASTDSLTNINIPSTQTVYTKSSSLVNYNTAGSVGVMYRATSNGVIGVSIQSQRSYAKPTTEAVADVNYISWNNAFTTTDNQWHLATLDTIVMPYLRFKITGTGSNDNSTTIQIKVEKE